jgi:cysteine-rich repeat protein
VTGNSNGTDWSWEIDIAPWGPFIVTNPGVGASEAMIVQAFIDSINLEVGAGTASLVFPAGCFKVNLPAGFTFYVMTASPPSVCLVSNNPVGCTFNPTILDVPMLPGATSCGDGVLDAAEQCDDGGNLPYDGCSAICEFEHEWAFSGTAVGGGLISFEIAGIPLSIVTTAGQTASQIAHEIAEAIAAEAQLASLGVWGNGIGPNVHTNALIDNLIINDSGISVDSPEGVPLSISGWVAALFAGCAWLAIRHGVRA